MSDVTTALHTALDEEPPLGFGAAEVIARAHRTRRRRRSLSLAATATAAAAVVAGFALTAGGPAPASRAPALSLTALGRIATDRPGTTPARAGRAAQAARAARVNGISTASLPGLIEKETGVKLTGVDVSALPPTGELDLAAAIDVAGQPYLNVQVAPAHSMITALPTCSELSDLSSGNGDGYYGPCSVRRLSDGSILIVRSGHTAAGGFTMAQAGLIHPDGSGIFAEDTNQAVQTPRDVVKAKQQAAKGHPSLPPVVRAEPVLDAHAMASLVAALAAQASS